MKMKTKSKVNPLLQSLLNSSPFIAWFSPKREDHLMMAQWAEYSAIASRDEFRHMWIADEEVAVRHEPLVRFWSHELPGSY